MPDHVPGSVRPKEKSQSQQLPSGKSLKVSEAGEDIIDVNKVRCPSLCARPYAHRSLLRAEQVGVPNGARVP